MNPSEKEHAMGEDDAGTLEYEVVCNDEEQYSIWPADKPIPAGWSPVGQRGSKDVCLDYIERVWTDMRPLSLRRAMEQAQPSDPAR
jgi:MbtH protein